MKKHRLPAAVLALAALGFTLGTCEFGRQGSPPLKGHLRHAGA